MRFNWLGLGTRCNCEALCSRETADATQPVTLRHNTSMLGRRNCLTHQKFLENLPGETVIGFPTQAARCCN